MFLWQFVCGNFFILWVPAHCKLWCLGNHANVLKLCFIDICHHCVTLGGVIKIGAVQWICLQLMIYHELLIFIIAKKNSGKYNRFDKNFIKISDKCFKKSCVKIMINFLLIAMTKI